jgi:hypothetical protein
MSKREFSDKAKKDDTVTYLFYSSRTAEEAGYWQATVEDSAGKLKQINFTDRTIKERKSQRGEDLVMTCPTSSIKNVKSFLIREIESELRI